MGAIDNIYIYIYSKTATRNKNQPHTHTHAHIPYALSSWKSLCWICSGTLKERTKQSSEHLLISNSKKCIISWSVICFLFCFKRRQFCFLYIFFFCYSASLVCASLHILDLIITHSQGDWVQSIEEKKRIGSETV